MYILYFLVKRKVSKYWGSNHLFIFFLNYIVFLIFQNYTVHVVPRLDAAFTGLVHSLSTCILLQFFSRSVNIESNFWKNQFFKKTDENYFINFPLSVGRIENFKSCFRALKNFTQTKDWMNKITHPYLNWLEKIKENNVFLRSSYNFFQILLKRKQFISFD